MHKNTPILEAKGIGKNFPSNNNQILHVLENIDLVIYPDEVVAFIGPSGCGKSTLLRILAGLIPQTSGEVFHHGKKLNGLLPNMSMVFQTFALFPWMTVQQNIETVLKAARVCVSEMEKKTKDAIALIGLGGFEDAYPREISGGMKQRVGIARALVRNPEILFMDEPFSEVDPFTAEVLRSEVIDIWKKKGVGVSSILLASHDVEEVAFMADRIVVLGAHPGHIRAVIENKLPRPRNPHSAEFLKLKEQLHDTYGHIKPAAEKKAKNKAIGPLLPVTLDQILGLLKFLNLRGGSQDIFKIGADSREHFDKVIVILQAAELLDFAEITQRVVGLTPKGKEFIDANAPTKQQIWNKQLMTIPLFNTCCNLLKKAPNQTLHRDTLLSFLSKQLPYQDPQTQLNIFIRWGHYGNAFVYHKKSKTFSNCL